MTDDNWVGQTLAGKYRVEQVLGKGGMGLVLGARHIRLDEPVAIKILRASMMDVDGMVVRFLKEARAASKIKSIHVVRVTDVDTLADGLPYMVMEHLTGVDFHELRVEQGKLGITDAVGYVLEACEAIGEAHSLGIVHRDLKPSNLFLHRRKDGRSEVKVLDFGISKLEAPGEQDTTKTGQMMGSPKYMSPEQMLSMHHVDARSDIWSLGAILYEFFTGRPPFLAETTPRICALVLNADPALPSALRSDLPTELEQIVLRCLQKDPDRRFASVAELVEALEPFGPAPFVESPRSTGTRARAMAPDPTPVELTAARPIVATSMPGMLPSGTPTPWDAETKFEGIGPRSPGRRRAAAVLAGVALVGMLSALYATEHGDRQVASGSPLPVTAEAAPIAAPIVTPSVLAAPPVVVDSARPAVDSARPAVDVAPLATVKPHSKKLKSAPSSDPFGGSRN